MACCACTVGVETCFSHSIAQVGCLALAETIHVSSQPVVPSFGIRSFTGTLAAISVFVWYGQEAPIVTSPFLNSEISSEARPQYFLTSGRCFLISAIAASNCFWFSSYGSVMPSDFCVFERYSAASAIWIGLFGTVILPLYFAS